MRKFFLGMVITSSLFCAPAFANTCLDNIKDHIYGYGTQLDLGNCNITDSDMNKVASILSKMPEIKDVFLDENDIGPKGIAELAGNQTISWLELHNNHIGPEGAGIVAGFTKLQILCLGNNHIGDAGVAALANNNTITQLFLNDNHITAKGIKALIKNDTVWNLSLSGNDLDKEALAALSSHQKLRWLGIEENNISPEGAEILVSNLPKLELLDISKNPIGNHGMKAIAKKDTLSQLYAMDCAIGPDGARYLAAANLKNLYDLVLDGNYVGDAGASALAKMPNLKFVLSLGENKIGDQGASALAENDVIHYLFLQRNYIKDEGAIALAKNKTLKILDVRYNQISEKGVSILKNSAIGEVDTGGNFNGRSYATKLHHRPKHQHHIFNSNLTDRSHSHRFN